MRKRISMFVRLHRRSLLQAAAILCVATSAAALVASTRTARGAVRPTELPESRDLPEGTVVSWAGRVHATAMLSHGAVSASAAQTVFATVSVGADRAAAGDRAPSTFVLVVDTSGSMAGEKIEFARQAAERFLAQVRDADEIAVVAYDSAPRMLVARGRASEVRGRAMEAIRGLVADGGTNIAAGLSMGVDLLRGSSSDRIRRVVLVSDGIDESGQSQENIVAVASAAAGAGISVSTIGVGADYYEPLMTRLADAAYGNYHFLRQTSELERILSVEYGQMGATVARDVVAEVELPPGVTLVRTSGAVSSQAGAFVSVRFGSLFGGDERRAVLELRTDARRAGPIGDVRARVRYVDRADREPVALAWKAMPLVASADVEAVAALTNPSALEEGVEVTAAARHDEAKGAWEQGDIARFRAIAEDNIARLRTENASLGSGSVAAQIAEYESHMQRFGASAPTSVDGRLLVKEVTVSNRARAARDNQR